MKEKNRFECPKIEIVEIDEKDIVTSSACSLDTGGGCLGIDLPII